MWKTFFFLVCALPSYSQLLPDEKNNIKVYKDCNESVVNITAVVIRRDFFFDIPQTGVGSGAILRPDGYIVTNDHVVGNAQQVEVTLFDKTQFPAKVVGTDPDSDLAVLRINPGARKLKALELGEGEDLLVGQKALAIGNPFGLGGSLTVGVISSLGRDIRATTHRLIKNVIQTDASINPGNSGGPLLDSSGRLIGINAQIVSKSGGSEGVGFAIPVSTVKKVTQQLIQFGRVQRPWLGIEGAGIPGPLLAQMGIPSRHGVMVTAVYGNGPAAESGLKPAPEEVEYGMTIIPVGGDVITEIDGHKVTTYGDILDYIFEKKAGDTVVLQYFRGKKRMMTSLKLAFPSTTRRR